MGSITDCLAVVRVFDPLSALQALALVLEMTIGQFAISHTKHEGGSHCGGESR